ncbi:MAG TPA: cyclopropane-fatty-acyl-phospholipid synthase family protein [Hyphomicrobium sp.]|nr:cyclopropane-fatty-acyl-phospholipid synthase family protein [Hyphomicrobium sp.]
MFAPLKRMLHEVITEGSLTVRDHQDRIYEFGDGTGSPVAIHFSDLRTQWAFVRDPELIAGEAYMDGHLTVDRGSIYDFIDLAMRNMAKHPLPAWAQAFAKLRRVKRRISENNPEGRSARNASYHYDLDQRFYDLFLDTDRQYSCAYYAPGISRLEDAQAAKKRHIAAKLLLEPGLDILDIGCGWGGLARYLATVGAARVRGITLSAAQLRSAIEHVPPQRGETVFAYEDYRTVQGTYDRIISVGMFEHVGSANYRTFFENIARLLKDDGVALIHAIGRLDAPSPTNPFIAKWIFPGGSLASLSEVTTAVENTGLLISDIEILRLHYAYTLRAWRERFLQHRERAVDLAGEATARMWEFYLAGCEAAFRHQFLMVFQIQLVKDITAVPITRDYMIEAERRLAAAHPIALRPAPELLLQPAKPSTQTGSR